MIDLQTEEGAALAGVTWRYRDAQLREVDFVEVGSTPKGQTRFERRPVAVNEDEGGDYLPVTHGLTAGERIVKSGAVLLSGML